jgi:hypothetical protein
MPFLHRRIEADNAHLEAGNNPGWGSVGGGTSLTRLEIGNFKEQSHARNFALFNFQS